MFLQEILLYISVKDCILDKSVYDAENIWVKALRPSQHFFSHVGTEPPLPGYYQYLFGR